MVKEKSIYDELSEERKLLQEQGKLPQWVTTISWQMLKEKYLNDQYPDLESVYRRVAKHAAQYTDSPRQWEDKFFNLFWKGWLAASTPVLSNMGTGFGCPVSCSGQVVGDSVYSFYESQKETAILSKNGFGTSGYLGYIRHRGAPISGVKGGASGVLPVFKDFVQVSRDISQGSQRRGAWAGYIEIDHPDYYELVNFIAKNPDDANIGWNITDDFIQRLESGDKDAVERYQKALKLKMITGKGYFFFVDKVNRMAPAMYKDKDLTIKASNLCLTGDTRIKIYGDISGMIDVSMDGLNNYLGKNDDVENWKVWSFDINSGLGEWKKITNSAQMSRSANVMMITDVDSGKSIKCTPEHKVYTKNRGYVCAKDLVETDELVIAHQTNRISKEIKIEFLDEEHAVYDITVEGNNNFFANDVLVHNCVEIALFSDDEYSFSCVLSSMNASLYDEWKDTDAVFEATVFLDCVNQDLIQIGKKVPGMEKVVKFAEESRALGLGVLGFHTYLQNNMIPFESVDAYLKNIEIFEHINQQSLEASKWMARQWGEPEWCKGYHVRNTHRMAVAPNLSSALICGSVSQGIEPIYKNAYVQNTSAGKMDRVNPSLLKLMKERNVYTPEIVKDIIKNSGSVQHVDWLNDHEKTVFKTAFEIDQKQIIRLASSRQKYIDQAQSINLFFSADESEEYISEVHKMAFLDTNIKSLYYIRSESGINVNKNECIACHG